MDEIPLMLPDINDNFIIRYNLNDFPSSNFRTFKIVLNLDLFIFNSAAPTLDVST
jgi:hypothetical protein